MYGSGPAGGGCSTWSRCSIAWPPRVAIRGCGKGRAGAQAHRRLAHYLLEEAYEAHDALDAQDLDAIREELGDVLFQVVLHARLAADGPRPWTIDDLAGELVGKLIRRNPQSSG